ncbi:MAG: CsbD family protein, partial [Gammaproteobacteria bacterium]
RLSPAVTPGWNLHKLPRGGQNMNWEQVKGNWNQVKGKARQMWGDITDDELDIIEGKREQLVGQLQSKYGYTKEKAEQEADSWVKGLQ